MFKKILNMVKYIKNHNNRNNNNRNNNDNDINFCFGIKKTHITFGIDTIRVNNLIFNIRSSNIQIDDNTNQQYDTIYIYGTPNGRKDNILLKYIYCIDDYIIELEKYIYKYVYIDNMRGFQLDYLTPEYSIYKPLEKKVYKFKNRLFIDISIIKNRVATNNILPLELVEYIFKIAF